MTILPFFPVPRARGRRALAATLAALLLAGCGAPAPYKAPPLPVFPAPPDAPRFYYERTLYSSADVEPDEKNAGLRRMLTGESRVGEGIAKPYGVAVHKGRVYVSDSARRRVSVFDIPGQRFFQIGEGDQGRLSLPLGIDVDAQGMLYVVDATTKLVNIYDGDGKFQRSLGGPKFFKRPSGIAVDKAGERLYVVDTGGVTNDEHHRVRVFDAKTGNHVLDFGTRGTGDGELNLPRDVAIGRDGMLYVVDGGNFRVQVFGPDGSFVKTFGSVGRQTGQFSRPKEAAVDADGNLYVVDAAFGNFQIFNPDGHLLMAVGSRSERDGMANYMLPSGIAVDADGRVYMVDQYFHKVDMYRPAALAPGAGMAVPPKAPAPAK